MPATFRNFVSRQKALLSSRMLSSGSIYPPDHCNPNAGTCGYVRPSLANQSVLENRNPARIPKAVRRGISFDCSCCMVSSGYFETRTVTRRAFQSYRYYRAGKHIRIGVSMLKKLIESLDDSNRSSDDYLPQQRSGYLSGSKYSLERTEQARAQIEALLRLNNETYNKHVYRLDSAQFMSLFAH